MKNPFNALHQEVDAWPTWGKNLYYAVEATLVASLAVFVGNYYFSLTNGTQFNWPVEFHDLLIAVQVGLVKAIWDALKVPNQVPLTPPATAMSQKDSTP